MQPAFKENPLVSVVIPFHNGAMFIDKCLQSILHQTFQEWEILVVDDGSTDAGPAIIQSFKEKIPDKIHYLFHSDRGNHGIGPSRNLGIKNAKGKLIAFLDQDDVWMPDKLAKQVKVMNEADDIAMIYAKSGFINDQDLGCTHHGFSSFGKGKARKASKMFPGILEENCIPALTVLVRKKQLVEVGMFNEGPRYQYEDWLLWSKLAYFNKFYFIPEILGHHRIHKMNYSTERHDLRGDFLAEQHYLIALFTFLLNHPGTDRDIVKDSIHQVLPRSILKLRSWGASTTDIVSFAESISEQLGIDLSRSKLIAKSVSFLAPGFAASLRRLRRKLVRM